MRRFYDLFAEYITGICSRYIDDSDDVKDVFQECMIKIVRNIGRFEYRGNGSLRSWVTRIAVNESLTFLKSRKQAELTALDFDIRDETETDDPDIADVPPEVIHSMIRQLPAGYRTVFNLYVIEGKSHKEIADMLNIKEASSASQFHRAKNTLAKEIERYRNNKGIRS